MDFFERRTGIAGAPGLRPDRGGAGRHLDAAQRAAQARLRRGRARPASRSGWSTSSGHAPEGEDPGEIWIRGANLFSGYWPDGEDGPDADGWYATGDVGFLDGDGDLFLVDRLKELVIVSGFNVYPVEVEEVVAEVDGVAEAAVIGTPDPRTGEAVVAYVKPSGTSYTAEELEQRVREHCAVRLARFKQPTEVHVVDELPHTGTGKVAKGGSASAGSAAPRGSSNERPRAALLQARLPPV